MMRKINVLSRSWLVYNLDVKVSTKYLLDSHFLNLPASLIFSKSSYMEITLNPTDFLSDELYEYLRRNSTFCVALHTTLSRSTWREELHFSLEFVTISHWHIFSCSPLFDLIWIMFYECFESHTCNLFFQVFKNSLRFHFPHNLNQHQIYFLFH